MEAAAKSRFLILNPKCCYCGGIKDAEEEDHVPSRQFFFERRRPNELVVPSCSACNRATSSSEQVVAALARAMREWSPRGLDDHRTKEILFNGVRRDVPEVLEEWGRPLRRKQRASFEKLQTALSMEVRPINVGNLTRQHIRVFAAKLAFALHYHSAKRVVPPSGAVFLKIRSIAEMLWQPLPAEFRGLFGDIQTLQQGRFEVSDQFAFMSASDHVSSAHWANISSCFELLLFAVDDLKVSGQAWPKNQIFRPGELRSPPRPIGSYSVKWTEY
jgi:hypothetical protein